MSGKLSLKTPSGGSVILEAVDTATDKVLTLPAVDSDVVTSAGARVADGAASAPSYSFGSSTGTGLFRPAANTLAFSTNGAERVRINSAGDVGIAADPARRLHVNGTGVMQRVNSTSASNASVIEFTNSNANAAFIGIENNSGAGVFGNNDAYGMSLGTTGAAGLNFATNNTLRMRINSGGEVLVGTTGVTGSKLVVKSAASATALLLRSSSDNRLMQIVDSPISGSPSGTSAIMYLERASSTSRSINASGTLNASGADYAEYMTKAGDFEVAKGDVVGINAEGKLTNVFADAISFCVKSTNPSIVGNDTWGYAFKDDAEGLETARKCVDRIAFAGQVPVNVLGATPGQFIIPVNDNGAIAGQPISNPTFEQYQIAVGKVIAIDKDGKARIIVKIA